jgi:hypothetical protein
VHSLAGVLMTTPLGWLLVAWFAWARAPHANLLQWLGGFFCSWLLTLALLRSIVREGPKLQRHGGRLVAIAALDGIGWGAVCWLVVGYSGTLDPWLGAVLCGVAAVNAPVYITFYRAYATLMAAIWITVEFAALLRPGHPVGTELILGTPIFCGLLAYHTCARSPVACSTASGCN